MSRTGRPRKAAALRVAQGNPGRRPISPEPSEPLREVPEAPEYLPELARAEWLRVAPGLVGLGALSRERLTLLEAYCSLYARWRKAEAHLAEFGSVVVAAGSGKLVANPHGPAATAALKQMREYAGDLGLAGGIRKQGEAPREQPKPSGFAALVKR